jgi:hypothetical protein
MLDPTRWIDAAEKEGDVDCPRCLRPTYDEFLLDQPTRKKRCPQCHGKCMRCKKTDLKLIAVRRHEFDDGGRGWNGKIWLICCEKCKNKYFNGLKGYERKLERLYGVVSRQIEIDEGFRRGDIFELERKSEFSTTKTVQKYINILMRRGRIKKVKHRYIRPD